MVALSIVQSSNSLISTTLPPKLVAVFVGATSGIGEATLKQFAKHVIQPRTYLIGRSQSAADRIIAECDAINPEGEYIFIQADVSLIRVVDEVCEQIKAKEETINLLFLSAGFPSLDRSETSEHLHLLAALNFYCRLRFMINLLPLIQRAKDLRRVVTVAGAGHEGPLDTTDLPALRVPLGTIRGHLTTLISLSLEAVARTAPEVSFVHNFPGVVNTNIFNRIQGIRGLLFRTYVYLFGWWVCVPIVECGERHLYLATSSRYPASRFGADGVPMDKGVDLAEGSTGGIGSGVYSVLWNGDSASPAAKKVLAEYRGKGVVDEIWRHAEQEFRRITQT